MKKLNWNEKILILPPSGIWDALMFLPVAYNLKLNFPNVKIDFLVNKWSWARDILKKCVFINSILEIDILNYNFLSYLKFFLTQFATVFNEVSWKYDVVMTVKPNLLRRILIFLISSKIKLISNWIWNQIFLWVSLLKEIENCSINLNYEKLLNMDEDDKNILLKNWLKNNEYIILNLLWISKSRTFNLWDDLINSLIKDNRYKIVILGKSNFYNKVCLEWVIDLVNSTSLEEAMILIDNCKLMISVDWWLMHIWISLNKPIIWLFWSVSWEYRMPINDNYVFFKYINWKLEKSSKESMVERRKDFNYLDNISIKEIMKTYFNFIDSQND